MLQVRLEHVRPGALLVAIRGDDRGELGHRPLTEIESSMGAEPLELFLDLRRTMGASESVRDLWTGWLDRHRDALRTVHVLTASHTVDLALEAARLLTRGPKGDLVRIHHDVDTFARALSGAGRPDPKGSPREAVLFATQGCAFIYRRLSPGALLVQIEGTDRGEFGDATLQEIERAFIGTKLELFVDTRATRAAAPAVSEAWGAWIAAHRAELRRVHVLASSRQVSLTLAVVQHLQGLADVMRLHTDPATFERELERVRTAAAA